VRPATPLCMHQPISCGSYVDVHDIYFSSLCTMEYLRGEMTAFWKRYLHVAVLGAKVPREMIADERTRHDILDLDVMFMVVVLF
jgi:hypothetical protein